MPDTRSTRNVWDDEPEAGFAGGDEFAGHSRSQAQTGQGAVPQNFEDRRERVSYELTLSQPSHSHTGSRPTFV